MHVTLVHVWVKPGHIQDFIDASRENHVNSVNEVGNCRFDVLQSPDQENYFMLYEAYDSADSAAAHKETAHYQKWRERVAPWMEKPRQGVTMRGLLPRIFSNAYAE